MAEASGHAGPFWRVFPWDPAAPDGAPYSARFVPPSGSQTGGRFDLGDISVLYLSEHPEHALAELLARFRGKPLRPGYLRRHDSRSPGNFHPLALVEAYLTAELERRLPDLGDPNTLSRFSVRPDALASHDRLVTQAISRKLHGEGMPGFRWWSALGGDWHVTLLYLDRVDGASGLPPPSPPPASALPARIRSGPRSGAGRATARRLWRRGPRLDRICGISPA